MGEEMRPPCRRPSFFFSSLKQVEERLKSEEKPQHHAAPTIPPPIPSSLSNTTSVPLEFLSQPLDFPSPTASTSSSLPKPDLKPSTFDDGDDIGRLLCLLGISASADDSNDDDGGGGDGGLSDFSDSAFYSKVVGTKGPKSAKEARRLDGWIDYYLLNGGDGETREPLRLAHLILGKAAHLNVDGLEAVEFPATVEEFLRIDPPFS